MLRFQGFLENDASDAPASGNTAPHHTFLGTLYLERKSAPCFVGSSFFMRVYSM